jgi:hypothetical protein
VVLRSRCTARTIAGKYNGLGSGIGAGSTGVADAAETGPASVPGPITLFACTAGIGNAGCVDNGELSVSAPVLLEPALMVAGSAGVSPPTMPTTVVACATVVGLATPVPVVGLPIPWPVTGSLRTWFRAVTPLGTPPGAAGAGVVPGAVAFAFAFKTDGAVWIAAAAGADEMPPDAGFGGVVTAGVLAVAAGLPAVVGVPLSDCA